MMVLVALGSAYSLWLAAVVVPVTGRVARLTEDPVVAGICAVVAAAAPVVVASNIMLGN